MPQTRRWRVDMQAAARTVVFFAWLGLVSAQMPTGRNASFDSARKLWTEIGVLTAPEAGPPQKLHGSFGNVRCKAPANRGG